MRDITWPVPYVVQKFDKFWHFRWSGVRGYKKYPKGTSLRESTSFEPFCVKIGWVSDLQAGSGKKPESHRDSHRKDMSPLTQGLNYRSAWVRYHVDLMSTFSNCVADCNIRTQFQCDNGYCISRCYRCNGYPVCSDESDERDCRKCNSANMNESFHSFVHLTTQYRQRLKHN